MVSYNIVSLIQDERNSKLFIAEAEFGYRYIKPYICNLPPTSEILEIGCGPCVLLAYISHLFPNLRITGIDPIGSGFHQFRGAIEKLRDSLKFRLIEVGYEQYTEKKMFDFIYMINSLEHTANWQECIKFIRSHLKSNGHCLILCPNYQFPFEPHFGIPLIFNKSITYALLRKRITKFESDNNVEGLWDSLNFIKLRKLKKEAAKNGLTIKYYHKIVSEMIRRLYIDEQFKQRHSRISAFSKILLKCGLVKLLEIPPFASLHPYVCLELKVSKASQYAV
jgi:SAM-dependent methyltransferase